MARFCSNCGGPVDPNQKFCMNCGAPIVEATKESHQNANAAHGASAGAGMGAGYQVPQPHAQVITNGSPLSRAWNDLRSEKNLIGRLIVLAVLGAIPILNFIVYGYCLIWCADAALGRKEGMPAKFMSMPLFTLGFFSFVVSLVWALVFGLLSAIPLLGIIASIAFLVLLPCLVLSQVRLALFGSLGSAFELTKIWDVFRSNMGSALAIFWAPQGIALVIILVVGFVVSLFGGLSLVTALYASGPVVSSAGAFGATVAFIIAAVLSSFVETAASLVVCRAFGYFVAESAPQWVRDGLVANPQARI